MDSIEHRFDRNRRIFGTEGVLRLMKKRVAVFGIGGVGGHAAEALVRSGIGAIDLIDGDRVSVSNINRQIVALSSTVGMAKVDVAERRFLDINPALNVRKFELFFDEKREDIDFTVLHDVKWMPIDTSIFRAASHRERKSSRNFGNQRYGGGK